MADSSPADTPSAPRPLLSGPFWFVRHGQSTTNAQELVAGWMDVSLTDLGRTQAAQAAEALAAVPFASVVVTGLKRTQQTAEPFLDRLSSRLGHPAVPIINPGLNERNWGELEGKSLTLRPSTFYDPPGGEPWDQFADRIWAAANGIQAPTPTLLVGHSGTFRALLYKMGFGRVKPQVGNADPIRFVPLDPVPAEGPRWRLEDRFGNPIIVHPSPPDESEKDATP